MELNKPILIILIVAITLAVFSLFVLPKYQESESLESELVQKRAQYEARADYYVRLADLLKDIEERSAALAKVESALPSSFEIAPVVFFLQKTAAGAGLTVNSIDFSEPAISVSDEALEDASSEIKVAEFNLELSGAYANLKNFLSRLESSARLFEVSSISFSSGSVAGIHGFSLIITTHTY